MTDDRFASGKGREALEKCYKALGKNLPNPLPEDGSFHLLNGDGYLVAYGADGEWDILLEDFGSKQIAKVKKVRGVKVHPGLTLDDLAARRPDLDL